MAEKKPNYARRGQDRLLDLDQISTFLGISAAAVKKLIKRKEIPALNLAIGRTDHWRIWQTDLVDFLESRKLEVVSRSELDREVVSE